MAEDCAFPKKAFIEQEDIKVAKAEWGLKRICLHCGTRFYDMKKNPPVCPSCGKNFDPESLARTRRGRTAAVEEKAKKPIPASAEVIEDLPVIEADEAEDTLIEDADELGEDNVDVEDVVDLEDGKDDDSH
jgi:uncharacterized protein (TIGR02300 family)